MTNHTSKMTLSSTSKSNVMGCTECCDPNEASMKVQVTKVNPTKIKKLMYTKEIR